MKKTFALLLSAIMALSITACDNKNSEPDSQTTIGGTTSSIISSTSTTTTPITDSPTQTTTVSTTVATVVSNKEKVQLYRN